MMRKFNKNKFRNEQDYEITVFNNPESIIAESYRKIPLNIKYSSIDDEVSVIQVTSTTTGEHKTTTVINLAGVYVELGKKVVVIDTDLRKPKIHYAFTLLNDEGLTSYLIGNINKDELIKKTKYGIDVITSGPSVPLPHVILDSDKFKSLIKNLKEEYDVIILDCPPVLVATDSLIVAEVADKTLFIINQEIAKKSEVKEAIKILKESKVDIAGIIATGIDGRLREYKYKYGYYYRKYKD